MRRRQFLWASGAFVAALPSSPAVAATVGTVEIAMAGRPDGSKVWFDPFGIVIRSGQTIRWTNRDPANAHTATAYSPENDGHPRRIPEGAAAFDSDYLLNGERFEVTLNVPGIYDYYCVPHELSGMVGRIIVAGLGQTTFDDYPDDALEQVILDGLPSVPDLLAGAPLRHEGG